MADGEYGYVTFFGNVNDVITDGWATNDTLYFDIELSYLYNFNTDPEARPSYETLIAKDFYATAVGGSSTINSSGIATLYFASAKASAPFITGDIISVRGVVAENAEDPTIYDVEGASVISCTTTYITYQTKKTTLPAGVLTITTAGLIDTKTLNETGQMNGIVNIIRNSVAKKTPGEVVTTGAGTAANPYLIDLAAWDIYYAKYTTGIGVPKLENGKLTNSAPGSSLISLPMATVLLPSSANTAGRILARPDVAVTLDKN